MPDEKEKTQIEVRKLEKLEPTDLFNIVTDPSPMGEEGNGRSPGI